MRVQLIGTLSYPEINCHELHKRSRIEKWAKRTEGQTWKNALFFEFYLNVDSQPARG